MATTIYQSNLLLDYTFGNTAITASNTYYIGLSTTAITAAGVGTEPVGNGYARVTVDNDKTTFTVAADGVLYNDIQIEFPESTDTWGTITHIAIYDANTNGNMLYYSELTTPRAVAAETTLVFVQNSIEIHIT